MATKEFNFDFSRNRKLVISYLIVQGVFLALFFLALILPSSGFRLFLLLLILLMNPLVILGYVGWLYLRYLKINEVKEKNDIRKKIKKFEKINHRKNKNLQYFQSKYEKEVQELNDKINKLNIKKNQEKEDQLEKLRNQIYSQSVRQVRIEDAKIEGVGPKLKGRLYANRITTLADININRIDVIPGFGEAKLSAILEWENFEKKRIKSNLPTKLSHETYQEIDQKYQDKFYELKENIETEKEELEHRFDEINREFMKIFNENDISDDRTYLDEKNLEYKDVLYKNFIIKTFDTSIKIKNKRILAIFSTILMIVILCVMTPLLCNTTNIDLAPTPTYTATATATATSTSTPTPTSTPTITNTPTPTNTPTITPTPTITNTPTITPWPTATSAPICACGYDAYNCDSFWTLEGARACYAYCKEEGAGDIHKLDSDKDGVACEPHEYPPTAVPTRAPVQNNTTTTSAVCSCASNTLDCGNFSTHWQAQQCYNYCVSLGRGDIHQLDRDKDGSACESLP